MEGTFVSDSNPKYFVTMNATTVEDTMFDLIKSTLYGSGIKVVPDEDETSSGVCLVATDGNMSVYYQHAWAGDIHTTEANDGEILWQCVQIHTIASKDLDRVVFGIVSLRPPPEKEQEEEQEEEDK